jgi:hypothetical protein
MNYISEVARLRNTAIRHNFGNALYADYFADDALEFEGQLFLRGGIGIFVGLVGEVTYNIELNTPIAWENLSGQMGVGLITGASVDLGGSAAGKITKKIR